MADILSFNLTQTESHSPRKMNSPDLSTKLKCVARFPLNLHAELLLRLKGVDAASFGDFFADKQMTIKT